MHRTDDCVRTRESHTAVACAQTIRENVKALKLLDSLRAHGFIPFHIHFTDTAGFLCCGVEYSFINARAPNTLLPAALPASFSTAS